MLVLQIDLLSWEELGNRTSGKQAKISENLLNKLHRSLQSVLIWDYGSSTAFIDEFECYDCVIYVLVSPAAAQYSGFTI